MPRSPMPLPIRLAFATVMAMLAIVLTACEPPIAPKPQVNGSGEPNLAYGLVYPNAVRYQDAGHKPATGRSGSARLMVRALLGRTGTTTLEVTTGTLDSPDPAPGNLDKIQLKLFDEDNALRYIQNHNGMRSGGYLSYEHQDLPRGHRVQVQANVSGIDARRMDVVTVSTTVQLRPDLVVAAMDLPASAEVNTIVNVSAIVIERNGDVGARANCVLYVDGTAVDRATGIWVDAGDAVTCAFAHAFTAVGTHSVEARVEDVVPGDDDPSNNSLSGTIEIVAPPPPALSGPVNAFNYRAVVSDATTIATTTVWNRKWNADSTSGDEKKTVVTQTSRQQFTKLDGSMPGTALTFPIDRVSVSLAVDGQVVHEKAFQDLSADKITTGSTSGSSCSMRSDLSVMSVHVCVDWKKVGTVTTHTTTLQYSRSAGEVTFRSTAYTRFWTTLSEDHYVYHPETNTYRPTGTMLKYGSTVTFGATIEDDGKQYSTQPSVAPSLTETTTVAEPTCTSGKNSTGFFQNCTEREWLTSKLYGESIGTRD